MAETYHKVEISSKEVLMNEAPPIYTASPRILPGLPCKKPLIIVVVVVVIVLVVLGFLLMGLHITQKHTETVLQMTIQGLDGEGASQHLSMSRKERLATFHVNLDVNTSGTVVYDFNNLLIGFRSWPGQPCYITRMNQENLQSLDAVVQTFQDAQARPRTPSLKPEKGDTEELSKLLVDRSILGMTLNILCSSIPIYWA